MPEIRTVDIGLIGWGTVGGGVVEILRAHGMRMKLVSTGITIVDGDGENDNVTNTGDDLKKAREEFLAKVWEFIRGKLKEGRQAYVVYPRVEGDDSGETQPAQGLEQRARRLARFKA